MRVRVKFFAIARDRAGLSETAIEAPDGANVSVVAQLLARQYSGLSETLDRAAFAVNQSYVDRNAILRDGDELAVIPPVSGG